jgi:hypothetical protein
MFLLGNLVALCRSLAGFVFERVLAGGLLSACACWGWLDLGEEMFSMEYRQTAEWLLGGAYRIQLFFKGRQDSWVIW